MPALAYCFSLLRAGPGRAPGRPKSRYVGVMLAHFSLLTAFFSLLDALMHFVATFGASWQFFAAFGTLQARFLEAFLDIVL